MIRSLSGISSAGEKERPEPGFVKIRTPPHFPDCTAIKQGLRSVSEFAFSLHLVDDELK